MAGQPILWLRRTAWALSFMMLGVVATLIASFVIDQSRSHLPPQLDGLSNQLTDIAPEFQRRLDVALAEGATEQRLIAVLSSWGFEFQVNDRDKLWASLNVPSFMCTDEFSVEWSKDEKNTVTQVVGHYHPSCL
jgi:hypothetical protein